MKSRKRKITIVALCAVLLASWYTVAKVRQAKANQPTIETAKIELGTVSQTVSATGILQPLTTVDIKSEAGGRVDLLAVDVGSQVTKGQLIAKIDPTDSQTALDQAEADLSAADARLDQAKDNLTLQSQQNQLSILQAQQAYDSAKARLLQAETQAKAQPTLTKASLDQAKANVVAAQESLKQLREVGKPQGLAQAKAESEQAEAGLAKSQRNIERQRELFGKGFISAGVLDTAELEYNNAKAQAAVARERMRTIGDDYESQLRSSEAKLAQAKAAYENAKANSIQDQLKQQDAVAARSSLAQAKTSLENARANVRQNRIRAADIQAANATMVRNKAQVNNARTQLRYTIITAPRDGVILAKYVEQGSMVTSGRSSSVGGTGAGISVVQLGDLSRMFVEASVDESDIASIEEGQTVDVTLDAYPDELFEGKVTKISPQTVTTQNVTTIPVTVEIDNPDARLKPGMNATCNFVVQRKENVLLAPTEAVNDNDGTYTVTLYKNMKQIERRVEVGIAGDASTEIVSGLKEGDEVVTAVIQPETAASGTRGGVPGSPFGGGMRGGRR